MCPVYHDYNPSSHAASKVQSRTSFTTWLPCLASFATRARVTIPGLTTLLGVP